ncbi:MAG: acetyl ornithine aminotransferase family protein [Candidatus Nephthysia bennettiae]|uniref:(S)-3-amino-2-methylpropionate transaminase n=1 Tax=Candidatus Nephthysia bennettiae TaxID=3127016 RepID=A0A934K7J0_9BACT|nr:acetyl ornithine aminotransferase family protein [Candidatus Dormibacteraeota bacterium]MBJ7610977.1 acetyl ornithine aminotransferase family protein [Candidatus Dormibacteraeota bacterium]PZS00473.1 MAG: acetyl ornithine aminotransferase family protein [Candidatus Dormibacteraeota bacterium]
METRSPTRRRPRLVTELPGPLAADLIERDAHALSPSFTRPYPFVMDSGEGCWATDVDGNVFLDFTAGIAVNTTGYSHPRVVEAITDQARRFLHMSGTDFYYRQEIELAERLTAACLPGQDARVFFTNSGAEAIEGAMKLVRYATQRPNYISFLGGFHGRTMGALSLTASKATQRRRFAPLLPSVYHIPFPTQSRGVSSSETLLRLEDLWGTVAPAESVAAVFVEPIQGEGGYLVPPDDFLTRLRELTARHGILLVVDEVQSGMGRTGKFLAHQHWEIQPDIVCLAKGLASGMPLGAFVAGAELMNWDPGSHGSTFGGNPVACVAALTTLDLIEGGLMENAAAVGAYLLEGLRRLAAEFPGDITDVRGLGLMVAVELKDTATASALMERAFRTGLLLLPTGSRALRLCPPLVLSEEEASTGLDLIRAALGGV